MEEDHRVPRALGGKNSWINKQLLHRHCHDEKTAIDLIEIREKKHSNTTDELALFWEQIEWEWINDIPIYKGHKAVKFCSDKRKTH